MSAATQYDVFNGDADGLCALHQLRLAQPVESILVTGVKRDIQLLDKVECVPGDRVTVLDISLDVNLAALKRILEQGGEVDFFDHHAAQHAFAHPGLDLHWDEAPDVCTSLLVDRHLQGKYRLWAIAAAFGDNLTNVASRLARQAGLLESAAAQLAELGSLLNYNAYGESLDDLLIAPAQLYRELQPFANPFDFIEHGLAFSKLRHSHAKDMAAMSELKPAWQQSNGIVYLLPNRPWARRISGLLANQLQQDAAGKAIAVMTEKSDASYVASIRSPDPERKPASVFCSGFSSGGGRRAAGGINSLPADRLQEFVSKFFDYF